MLVDLLFLTADSVTNARALCVQCLSMIIRYPKLLLNECLFVKHVWFVQISLHFLNEINMLNYSLQTVMKTLLLLSLQHTNYSPCSAQACNDLLTTLKHSHAVGLLFIAFFPVSFSLKSVSPPFLPNEKCI